MVLKGSSPIRLSILTPGYLSANSQGFLHPLLVNRGLLKDCNLDLKIFTNNACEIQECDALLIDSKYFKLYWGRDIANAQVFQATRYGKYAFSLRRYLAKVTIL